MGGNEEGKERVSGVEEHFGYKKHRTIDPSYSRLATKMHLQSYERPEEPPCEEDSSLTLQTSDGKRALTWEGNNEMSQECLSTTT